MIQVGIHEKSFGTQNAINDVAFFTLSLCLQLPSHILHVEM